MPKVEPLLAVSLSAVADVEDSEDNAYLVYLVYLESHPVDRFHCIS